MAFTSMQLCDHNFFKSTYEKEMMAMLHAVDTMMAMLHAVDIWKPCLLGNNFQMKKNHHILKHFLK